MSGPVTISFRPSGKPVPLSRPLPLTLLEILGRDFHLNAGKECSGKGEHGPLNPHRIRISRVEKRLERISDLRLRQSP